RVERQDVKFDANVGKRLERQVIEASKQCGRLRLMEIGPELSRREIIDWLPKEEQVDLLKILSHPISDGAFGQLSFGQFMERFTASGLFPRRILIAIGPVGGLTHAEVQEAVDDQWDTLDLGEQVYRVETAAIVAASLFLHMN
ncbi:MAG: RsmE family RNA methyltransferase, partial [Planctomycetia bacterium]|nr:RsmE family RNA methyltransferase [Planctomycetia bacterium]